MLTAVLRAAKGVPSDKLGMAGVRVLMLTHIRQLLQLPRHLVSGLLVRFDQQHLREHDEVSFHDSLPLLWPPTYCTCNPLGNPGRPEKLGTLFIQSTTRRPGCQQLTTTMSTM